MNCIPAAAVALLSILGPVRSFAGLSAAATDHVRMMNATRAGVDRSGSFWYWDSLESTVTRLTVRGDRATARVHREIRELDADRERGIVTLDVYGTTVRVTDWSGAVTNVLALPFEAANVCWMDRAEVAIAPETIASRVVVWSISAKKQVRAMGPVPEIRKPAAGAVLTRATLLAYDDARSELVTLDAFTGELAVFGRDGELVRRGSITHPLLEANNLWLRELDRKSRQTGESQSPNFWNYPRMSLTADGSIWLGEKSGDPAGSVIVAKILPSATVSRTAVVVPECASIRFELWQNQLIFFRSSRSTRCVAIKEVAH